MTYFFNTPQQQKEMCEVIGIQDVDELFSQIPAEFRLTGDLQLPAAMGELELTQHMTGLAAKNYPAGQNVCFLGAGSYDHFIPATVDAIASRSEFYTSYTPYQPEVSQGNLQATFEYQSLICQLTGMEVSNASLYDGGSAVAEAVLMCLSATRRYGKVVTVGSVHPEYRQTTATYLQNLETELVTVPTPGGTAAPEQIAAVVDDTTACVLIQHPNFFGCLEEVEAIAQIAHDHGALLVQSFDPISLGLLKRPADLGADVAVAEGQSLGTPMQFGGPYLGILACREKFVRRMPGRIVGQTEDRHGRRCWVLTLQTREQHIRREKATSNICTNQGLFALRASVYLAAMGPKGLKETATLSMQKAHYAAECLSNTSRLEPAFAQPFFKEFVVRDENGQVQQLLNAAQQQGILAGVSLGKWFPELSDCFLVTVTEKRTKSEIDQLTACLGSVNSPSEILHA